MRRRRRVRLGTLALWVAAALVLMLIGALAGFFISQSQAENDRATLRETEQELSAVQKGLADAEDRSANYYRANQLLQAQLDELRNGAAGGSAAEGSTTTTTSSGPRTTFTDGIYLVGVDIQPGTYDGVVTASLGYWARLKDTDGLVSSIVANGLPRGPFVLRIVESDVAVELRGVELKAH